MVENNEIEGVAWIEHMPGNRVRYSPSNDDSISIVILEKDSTGCWARWERDYGSLAPTFYKSSLNDLDRRILGLDNARTKQNEDLIAILLKKGVLQEWYGNSRDFFCLPLPPNLPDSAELTSIPVKKDDLKKLVEGAVEEITANIHQDVERRSLYNDETIDVRFYDGTAKITFDREKQVFDAEVSGSSYWDTSAPSCCGPRRVSN